jgi:hypothetical protein
MLSRTAISEAAAIVGLTGVGQHYTKHRFRLEPDYKRKYALECDLTFWAVQFLTLVEERSPTTLGFRR